MVDAMLAASTRVEIDTDRTGHRRGRARAATVRTRSTSAPSPPSSWPAPAGRCASTATGPPRPRAAPPTCWRPSAWRSSSGPVGVAACVREARMGFCFAPRYHPAMRHAGPSRRDLGIPTAFNILGPLSNPGRVRRYLIGVADLRMAERMAGVLQAKGAQRALIVHGGDGLDELTTTGPSTVVELRDGAVSTWELQPTDLGLALVDREDLVGGDAAVNADLARRVLAGEHGSAPRHREPQRRRRAPGGRPRRRPAGRPRRRPGRPSTRAPRSPPWPRWSRSPSARGARAEAAVTSSASRGRQRR